MLIFLIIPFGIILYLIIRNEIDKQNFEKSSYKDITGEDYKTVSNDKGKNGERLIYEILEKLPGSGRILTNVYIPKGEETTEIDIIYIHRTGIYVIESKNYSGIIYGKTKDYQWTQVLNKNNKYKFYNPIKQNETHMRYLKLLLNNLNSNYFKSIVVFGERCELKINSKKVKVINRNLLKPLMLKYIKERKATISLRDIEKIYQFLLPYTNIDEKIKMEHIKNIKNHASK